MNRRGLMRGAGAAVLAAVFVLAAVVTPALAQKKEKEKENERSVVGVVLDETDSPIEGAVVQLKDTKTQQSRRYITKTDGRYQFHNLNTQIDYELTATHQGKSSNKRLLSTFDSRKHPSMNLKIEK